MSNTPPRYLRALILRVAAAALFWPGTASAQVGHAPESSPYRDLRAKHILSFTGGYVAGNAGKAGVGPTNGRFGAVRYDLHLSGATAMGFGFSFGYVDRLLIDPREGPDTRTLGNATQSLVMADFGINLVLTGAKTWRRLAPYLGFSLGLALGGEIPEDSLSGFNFSTKFQLSPQAGVRWYVTDRLSIRLEGRDILWRLSYPDSFFAAPANDLTTDPILDLQTTKKTQWTHNPTLLLSLGYAVRM